MSQRWYDPSLGQFLSKDPIGFLGGLNLRSYAAGNPTNLVDPDGFVPLSHTPTHMEYQAEVSFPGDPTFRDYVGGLSGIVYPPLGMVNSAAGAYNNPGGPLIKGAPTAKPRPSRPDMGQYRDTRGHHPHAKQGFLNDPCINNPSAVRDNMFAISNEFMKRMGWNHGKMTAYQQRAFRDLFNRGIPIQMKQHTQIAVDALVAGGADRVVARAIVAKSLRQLRAMGIRRPTNAPWVKNLHAPGF